MFGTKGFQMDLLVVGLVVDPTAIDDANPLEGERADGGRVLEAAGAHLVVVGSGPGGVSDRLKGEFVRGLADEVGASQPALNEGGFATFLSDGRKCRNRPATPQPIPNGNDRYPRRSAIVERRQHRRQENFQRVRGPGEPQTAGQ